MTIYGECIGTRERMPVTISALGDEGCELYADIGVGAVEGAIDLWIGAIGPLRVTTEQSENGRFRARFLEPLDERIIAHFAQD